MDGMETYVPKELLDELPDFAPPKKDEPKHADESATENLEHELADTFSWLAKISAVLAVLIGALGFIFPLVGRFKIGRWLGIVALCSIGTLYFIPYFPYIFGTAALILFLYLLWKLYRVVKEKIELEELAAHLSIADRDESKDIMKAHQIKKKIK